MNQEEHLSDEQLDFIREMMNIGAGNAATALSQLLGCKVDMEIPSIGVFPGPELPSILDDPSLPVACVMMHMVGDVLGDLFFIVPREQRMVLADLAERASGMRNGPGAEAPDSEDLSLLKELANMVGEVYLTAIHDFCKLTMYHTVPTVAADMVGSLVDEALSGAISRTQTILVIENRFDVEKKHCIRAFLLMVPLARFVKVFGDSMEVARRLLAEG